MTNKILGMTSLLLFSPACVSVAEMAEPTREPVVEPTAPERDAPNVLYESRVSIDPAVANRMNMRMASERATEAASNRIVAPTMAEACGWDSPTFYFRTATDDVTFIGDVKLDALATCLKSEPIADEPIVIIGHADTRGDAYDNLELGLDRANTVKSELVALGVEPTRIETYSRGEYRSDADDETFDDRRVVVSLDR